MADFSGYQSPFSWRYGSREMRSLWSETRKRELWRRMWVCLARAESAYGLVSPEQVKELEIHAAEVDIDKSLRIEAEIRHDLMAEIKAFAEQCPSAGGIIHLGATSMDIEDNAEAIRLREALSLTRRNVDDLLNTLADCIDRYADIPVMGFTHLQPAEPTTFGYRCAVWAQDILYSRDEIGNAEQSVLGKGFKGAVGTSASYAQLIGKDNLPAFEKALEEESGLEFFPVATQTSTRLQEYKAISALATLAAALHKMAFDLRILQSPPIGEVAEPFGKNQVGSSAMPFKRNPIEAEKIDSLARLLAAMPQVAWSNASLSLLERTLDDSANRRTILPESFLIADELIRTAGKILKGLALDRKAVADTLRNYAPFSCTERVLMAASKKGADRQEAHERLRERALEAWAAVRRGEENPLSTAIAADSFFLRYLGSEEIAGLMDIESYLGDAVERARDFAKKICGRA